MYKQWQKMLADVWDADLWSLTIRQKRWGEIWARNRSTLPWHVHACRSWKWTSPQFCRDVPSWPRVHSCAEQSTEWDRCWRLRTLPSRSQEYLPWCVGQGGWKASRRWQRHIILHGTFLKQFTHLHYRVRLWGRTQARRLFTAFKDLNQPKQIKHVGRDMEILADPWARHSL